MIKIRKVANGYIIESLGLQGEELIYLTLDEVFEHLLMVFEGRGLYFCGDLYGQVVIRRDRGNKC